MPALTPRDLELHVGYSPAANQYSVLARLPLRDLTQNAIFTLDITPEELQAARTWMETGRAAPEAVAQFGTKLFAALIGPAIEPLYRLALQDAGQAPAQEPHSAVRLRLYCGDGEAAGVPWELLHDPLRHTYVALLLSLVRDAPATAATYAVAVTPPLRILVVQPTAAGLPELQSRWEGGAIGGRCTEQIAAGKLVLEILPGATLRMLQDRLRTAAGAVPSQPYHILHFVGHGLAPDPANPGGLVFGSEDGSAQVVAPEQLVALLQGFQLRLVFLNACASGAASPSALTQGLAPALLASGIPAVIGMQVAVEDRQSRGFEEDYYAALADGRSIDAALMDTRRLALGHAAALAIPICYLRTDDSTLLLPIPNTVPEAAVGTIPGAVQEAGEGAGPQRRGWWSALSRTAQFVVGLLGLVATVLGIYQGVVWLQERAAPSPMDGDFNIAVAPYYAPGREAAARRLADSVYREVEVRLAPLRDLGYEVQIRGPADLSAVAGETEEARLRAAEEIAAGASADVLLFGYLTDRQGATALAPEVYVNAGRLQGAEEAAGYDLLGEPLVVVDDIAANPAAAVELQERLSDQAPSWAEFALGLGYVRLHDYTAATHHLNTALHAGTVNDKRKRVLYLYLGSLAAHTESLPEASAYYSAALTLDPNYARARLGKAQVGYLLAMGEDCSPESADRPAIEQAIAEYTAARSLGSGAAAAIPIKADVLVARAYGCLSLATQNDAAQSQAYRELAKQSFQAAIDYYEGLNTDADKRRVAYVAAEARGGLGLIQWHTCTPDTLAAAQEHFQAAETMSTEEARRMIYVLWQARTHAARQECTRAGDAVVRVQTYVSEQQAQDGAWRDPTLQHLQQRTQAEIRGRCEESVPAPIACAPAPAAFARAQP